MFSAAGSPVALLLSAPGLVQSLVPVGKPDPALKRTVTCPTFPAGTVRGVIAIGEAQSFGLPRHPRPILLTFILAPGLLIPILSVPA
jgi:hypothetical protein